MNLKGRIDRLSHRMTPNGDNTEELEMWARLFAKAADKDAPTSRNMDVARNFIAWCHARGEEPALGWLVKWAKS